VTDRRPDRLTDRHAFRPPAGSPILEVQNLRTWFRTDVGVARAVDGVSFHVNPSETLGIVGESGSGKSVTALSAMRLIPTPPGEIQPGSKILFHGERGTEDLATLSEERMRGIRGNDIAMIFQEPMTSLNPVFRIGDQIMEPLRLHQGLSKKDARDKAIEMLKLVGIPIPGQRVDEYPHQLSGGMRQRVMIAIALACDPKILIADEPTTALDVTIQAQILELLNRLQDELGMAIILITHDLGVVAETCDRVIVMYAGQVMEEGPVGDVFRSPQNPYTEGLLRSIPRLGSKIDRLAVIPGTVPNPLNWPAGCRFQARCPYAWEKGLREEPPLFDLGGGRKNKCWLVESPERRAEVQAWSGGMAAGPSDGTPGEDSGANPGAEGGR
jgi:oligopeptide/dipeptide ABC transporter ATP-binding protein